MRYIPHIGDTIHTEDNDGHCTDTVVVDVSRETPIPYAVLQSGGETFTRAVHELQDHLPSMQDTKVIALTGEDRVGKSRIAEALVDEYARLDIEAEIVSFADPLRTIARNVNIEVDLDPNGEPLGYEDAFRRIEVDVINELRDTSVSGYEFDRRINDRMKQHLGYRDALGRIARAIKWFQPTFFVDQALNKIHHLANAGISRIIIDDLRFPVEYEYLKAMLHDFTVYHLVSEGAATQEANPADVMRHEWRNKTGGATIIVPEGKSDRAIRETADRIIKHLHKPKQDQGQVFLSSTGASLSDSADWGESVGIVSGDGIQLTDDTKVDWHNPKQVSMTIDFDADEDIARLLYGIDNEDNEEEKEEEQTELLDFTIRPQQLVVVQQDPELQKQVDDMRHRLEELEARADAAQAETLDVSAEKPDPTEVVETIDKAAKQIIASILEGFNE